MRTITILGLVTLLTACAVSKVEPLSVPLQYHAVAKPFPARAGSCLGIAGIEVDDRRAEKVLGTRFHDTKPLKAEVNVASDPAVWIRAGMQDYLSRNGVGQAASGPKLLIELHVLRTEEEIWHRSTYDAKMSVVARVQSRSGKICAEQSVEGKAGNYGYSGSIENYQETLNSALDDATQRLLDMPQFAEALCQCNN